jgi:glutamate---cysteine ligase / carboxylate-amine ligase
MRDIATEAAAEHGLEEVERLAREGNGAERQRAIHARGGMKFLLSELVQATSDF